MLVIYLSLYELNISILFSFQECMKGFPYVYLPYDIIIIIIPVKI